jgi:hypothetical protein
VKRERASSWVGGTATMTLKKNQFSVIEGKQGDSGPKKVPENFEKILKFT